MSFRRKELTTAMSAYRIAESKLSEVEDEIEKAEFFQSVLCILLYETNIFLHELCQSRTQNT